MLHSDCEDYTAAANHAKALETAFREQPRDVLNRLFFAARNGAISLALREVENHFGDRGMNVRAHWHESSFGNPHIEIAFKDKRSGEHPRRVALKRSEASTRGLPSNVLYTLQSVEAEAYYPRKPKAVEAFEAELGSEDFQKKMRAWVAGTNHPFRHQGHSVF